MDQFCRGAVQPLCAAGQSLPPLFQEPLGSSKVRFALADSEGGALQTNPNPNPNPNRRQQARCLANGGCGVVQPRDAKVKALL